jgi:2-methylisocitrate lyase-like PEP mutase family enzyme
VSRPLAEDFLALHRPGSPLLVPNPWDAGSARVLAMLGFQALATTSSGFAATLARLDGSVTRDEALAHAAHLVAAVDVPITADLENGFADEPAAVAVTVTAAAELGLAGCSIEDNGSHGIYDAELAADRVATAVEAAAGRLILTARADNFLHDRNDLADTITRLQRYQDAGADVLYAPGLTRREDIAAVIHSVDRPVNALLLPNGPTVTELATLGVSRVSIGGTFTYAAFGALAQAAKELHGAGPNTFWDRAAQGRDLIQASLAVQGGERRRPRERNQSISRSTA